MVEQSKSAVMEAAAIQDSDQVMSSLTSVTDALQALADAPCFSHELYDKATSVISACGNASAHIAACKASEKPEAREKAAALESGMAALADMLEKHYFASRTFTSFLDTLWRGDAISLPAECAKAANPKTGAELNLTPLEFLSRMVLEGTVLDIL